MSQVPILDGSAKEWVTAIEETGLIVASDREGKVCDKVAPYLNEPVYVFRNDAFVTAFPSPTLQVTCGIDFPQVNSLYMIDLTHLSAAYVCTKLLYQVPAIGRQWLSYGNMDREWYTREIASSRTFCIFEEVQSALC